MCSSAGLVACLLLATYAAAAPPAGFEEAWRASALQFARTIQPHMSTRNLQELSAGLNTTDPKPPLNKPAALHSPPRSSGQPIYYVSPSKPCDDNSTGSKSQPLCTVAAGVTRCRATSSVCTVLLRAGTHRLAETIVLTAADSRLQISSFSGERAVISGAAPLAASAWSTVRKISPTLQLWKAKVQHRPPSIDTLLVDGVRAIPARFPNADPELDKFPIGYITQGTGSWHAPADLGDPTYIQYNSSEYFRPSYRSLFTDYRGGVGGQCSHYEPPFSYWCAETPQGGGASQFTVPSGLSFDKATVPHAPYANASGARITSWRPGHWANWQFEVNGSSVHNNSVHLSFSKGGFQGGRGNRNGADWFVSHVPEELDFPREFWFDSSESMLYFVSGSAGIDCHGDPNCDPTRTQPAPPSSTFEAAQVKALFELRGSQRDPVVGVTFSDLTLTGTAETFLDPHGVPSGGDWALQRSAAMFFEGTVNTTLENCDLIRLDGNAVMLSGFNQFANIAHNTFLSTGASAIALWGYSNGTHPSQPEGTGPDGTEGNFPRWSTIDGNFFRHLGIHEKQSSCIFQAKAAQTTISNNICFDVPRAGININDGFGGGNDIKRNLLFQTCGESGDHGALNTWDRQSFLTTVRTGEPSIVPASNEIHHNFIVSDYDANGGMIDNDDGSSFYKEYSNFGIYGGAKFGNIDGHAKVSYGNIYAFPNVYGKSCFWHWPGWFPLPGYEEQFFNNTCIMDGPHQSYISMPKSCNFENASTVHLIAHNNKVFAPQSDAVVSGCGGKSISFAQWTQLKIDTGSTLSRLPSNEQIVEMGMALLLT